MNAGDTPELRAAQARLTVTWPMTASQVQSFICSWNRSPFPQELLERKAEFMGVSQKQLADLIPPEHRETIVRTCESCEGPFSQKRDPGSPNVFHVCAACAARKAQALGVRAHAAEGWR